jgi:hypothetical protein
MKKLRKLLKQELDKEDIDFNILNSFFIERDLSKKEYTSIVTTKKFYFFPDHPDIRSVFYRVFDYDDSYESIEQLCSRIIECYNKIKINKIKKINDFNTNRLKKKR